MELRIAVPILFSYTFVLALSIRTNVSDTKSVDAYIVYQIEFKDKINIKLHT